MWDVFDEPQPATTTKCTQLVMQTHRGDDVQGRRQIKILYRWRSERREAQINSICGLFQLIFHFLLHFREHLASVNPPERPSSHSPKLTLSLDHYKVHLAAILFLSQIKKYFSALPTKTQLGRLHKSNWELRERKCTKKLVCVILVQVVTSIVQVCVILVQFFVQMFVILVHNFTNVWTKIRMKGKWNWKTWVMLAG